MVKRYLDKLPLKKAIEILEEEFKDLRAETEIIAVDQAVGRVTAQGIKANRSAPDFYASAMDGIAVKAKDTADASSRNPIILKKGVQAVPVDTGNPIPEGFNAVIKIEEVNEVDVDNYQIEKSVPVWNHIRSIGESVVKGNLILTAGHKIRDFDLGALLEAGVTELEVYKKPKVIIIPTGDELVRPSKELKKGELVEFNSAMVKSALIKWGAEVKVTDIIKDNKELIKKEVKKASKECQLLIILSGSSAGRKDFTRDILKAEAKILFHGVNIMPGKPILTAKLDDKAVVALPGYPISALLDNYLFVRELIYLLQGQKADQFDQEVVEVKRKISSDIGLEEFIRVNLIADSNGQKPLTAVPLKRGSSAMESIIKADAILRISENKEGLAPGDKAPAVLLKSKAKIKKDLLLIGSHDLSLDLIRNEIAKRGADFRLKLQTVGSMAGLTALRRGESHLAGAHLLDSESGEYNISYLKRFFKNKKIALINLVNREQGFYLKKGNPKNISSISDLKNKDINFVNRQRGAGTRVLFDYLLKEEGIDSTQINGYNKEEFTHIAAAAAVGRGSADAALGIRAAAEVIGVDFLSLTKESYDLILEAAMLDDPRIEYLIKLLREKEIKEQIKALGGYEVNASGSLKILEL